MIYYLIPARKNSKGFPGKNRKLLSFTLDNIPEENKSSVIVSTDDEFIVDFVKNKHHKVKIHRRSDAVSSDIASPKDIVVEVTKDFKMRPDDEIITMYLTYPERKHEDVEKIYKFFKSHNGSSLLCASNPDFHPYRAYYALEGYRGKKVVEHDLHRRQDYPKCFIANHFVSIIKVEYVNAIDENLYHPQTIFYHLDKHTIDIDTEKDLEKFKKGNVIKCIQK